jgi:hypothetical protein
LIAASTDEGTREGGLARPEIALEGNNIAAFSQFSDPRRKRGCRSFIWQIDNDHRASVVKLQSDAAQYVQHRAIGSLHATEIVGAEAYRPH